MSSFNSSIHGFGLNGESNRESSNRNQHTFKDKFNIFLANIIFVIFIPLRRAIDNFEIKRSRTAHFIAKMIPAQCPFERTISIGGHELFHIPPLCKLNPLYNELVNLRFRALCFLVDQCGEDISIYC
ncbi:MAG: Mo-dependent nitrogenase C-terminal domain-containing protein [Pseudanabaenaceae cyanobacterium bins.39]|nr:Mo-dependent nitrogenase C-terminal domain-containing protein [Pseudanabaenaceae cyanobacterium bins.39]